MKKNQNKHGLKIKEFVKKTDHVCLTTKITSLILVPCLFNYFSSLSPLFNFLAAFLSDALDKVGGVLLFLPRRVVVSKLSYSLDISSPKAN